MTRQQRLINIRPFLKTGLLALTLAIASVSDRSMLSVLSTLSLTAPASAQTQPATHISDKLSDYVVPNLADFETTMKAVFHDDNAARKIDKDAGLIYQLKSNVKIRYKEENKFRADGQIGINRASLIINDSHQTYRLSLGVKKTEDLGNAPGKRKSLLDVGLLSDYYLTYAQGEFMGVHNFEGTDCAVFKLTFKDRSLDTSHRIIWIDPKTRITLKREEYLQDSRGGKLRDTWFYRRPIEVAPGLFFPSRIELFNNENKKAGETAYTETKVNIGLKDDVFRL